LWKREKFEEKREKQKFESIFFVQKYYERRKWKKEIGVKIRKQNFQKHILHKKLESRFVGEKNTKIPGQKLLETSIGVKNLKQKKIREKYIKRNPKIKKLEQNFGKIKKLQTNVIVRNEKHNKNFGGKLENKSLRKIWNKLST